MSSWSIRNLADLPTRRHPIAGLWADAGGDQEGFDQIGVHVRVLEPGMANARYHVENTQEGFLVLDGECLVIIDGEEHRAVRWDLIHCAPGTPHVLVGAGDRPCTIFMFGSRREDHELHFPADATAARHGASVDRDTADRGEAYADWAGPMTPATLPWPPGSGT